MRSKLVFLYVDSLMCQSVNLSWKIVVQNASFIFAYFCGAHKNDSAVIGLKTPCTKWLTMRVVLADSIVLAGKNTS